MEESCLQRLLFNKMLNFPVLSTVFKYDASFWFLKTFLLCFLCLCLCPCSGVAVTELGPLAYTHRKPLVCAVADCPSVQTSVVETS